MGMLDGQVAVVTASAGAGIGSATALRFAQEGAKVVVSDLHPQRTKDTAAQIAKETGAETHTILCDVSDPKQVDALVKGTIDRFGQIDVWVNNAARNIQKPLHEYDDETWNLIQSVTLGGTFNCLRAVLPKMYERRTGRIVNMTSAAGWGSGKNGAGYAVAKAGVMAITRSAAAEAGEFGVRVNAVAPTFTPNPFLARVYTEEQLAEMGKMHPFGRGCTTEEMANVILFLSSNMSSYMTGEVLSVSGQHA